jgi:hypothetical protein
MGVCQRGGDCAGTVNLESTTVLPAFALLGVTDFAIGCSTLSPALANGSAAAWADAFPAFDRACRDRDRAACDPLASLRWARTASGPGCGARST